MNNHRLNLIHRLVKSDDNLEILRMFLTRGISPNLQNNFRHTLLHTAATSSRDNIQIVRELINAGADLDLRNLLGLTPLHFAVVYRKGEMVEALLQARADINARTPRRVTALHYAINNSRSQVPRANQQTPVIELVRMLLQHEDINVDARDLSGETPLIWAVAKQETLVVKALLARGADPMVASLSGETPMHYAFDVDEPCLDIVFILLRHGARLNSLNRDYQTPLDFLIDRIGDAESLSLAKLFVKKLVFQYKISPNIARNLERNRALDLYLQVCRAEVDLIKTQVICGKITIHDFMLRCYNKDQFYGHFDEPALEIYKPIVDILSTGLYSAYLFDILNLISKYQLWNVLTYNLSLKTQRERLKIISHLHFFYMCINGRSAIYNYLSRWQIFKLILVASNLSNSMVNFIKPIKI